MADWNFYAHGFKLLARSLQVFLVLWVSSGGIIMFQYLRSEPKDLPVEIRDLDRIMVSAFGALLIGLGIALVCMCIRLLLQESENAKKGEDEGRFKITREP